MVLDDINGLYRLRLVVSALPTVRMYLLFDGSHAVPLTRSLP